MFFSPANKSVWNTLHQRNQALLLQEEGQVDTSHNINEHQLFDAIHAQDRFDIVGRHIRLSLHTR